jgi:lipid A 3-O-deacylase
MKFRVLLLLYALTGVTYAQSADSLPGTVSSIRFFRHIYENDFFDNTDMYYTQGLRYELFLPVFRKSPLSHLLIGFKRNAVKYYSISLNQDCYTPSSIRRDTLFTGDRPFAAALYVGSSLISNDANNKQRLSSELDLGVLGPCAKCEEEQKAIHRALVNIQPLGWQFQEKTDVLIDYSVMYEKGLVTKKYLEFILQGKGIIGSIYDYLNAGAMLRTGKMTGYFNALGPGETEESQKLQIYGYIKGYAQIVGYNASMQGGLFDRESVYTLPAQSIERVIWCFQYGAVVSWKHLSFELSNVEITPEFKNGMAHAWGHVNVTLAF